MKQVVGCLCGTAAAGLVLLFCMQILFYPPEDLLLGERLSQVGYQAQSKVVQTENPQRLKQLISLPSPQLRSVGKVCVTGRREDFLSFFEVQGDGDTEWKNPNEAEEIQVALIDITNQAGQSVCKKIWKADELETDEIETPVSYFVETNELCFYQSGSYVLKIKAMGEYGRYCTVKIAVPVEVE